MIGRTDIRNYARRIVKEFRPERVVLFGSHAYGKPTDDSDVDLLVIMDHDKPRNVDQAIAIQIKIAAPFPLDLLVKRPAEVAKRLSMNDTFLRSVVQDGQVLYG